MSKWRAYRHRLSHYLGTNKAEKRELWIVNRVDTFMAQETKVTVRVCRDCGWAVIPREEMVRFTEDQQRFVWKGKADA